MEIKRKANSKDEQKFFRTHNKQPAADRIKEFEITSSCDGHAVISCVRLQLDFLGMQLALSPSVRTNERHRR